MYLECDRDSVGLVVAQPEARDASGAWLDAHMFGSLATSALAAFERGEDAHELGDAALTLYRGPFLAHETWITHVDATRLRYHNLLVSVVRHLARLAINVRQFDHAVRLLGRVVEEVPDDEDAAARLMAVQAAAGRRGDAIRQYATLRRHLAEQEMAPAHNVQALCDAIRDGDSMQEWLEQLF